GVVFDNEGGDGRELVLPSLSLNGPSSSWSFPPEESIFPDRLPQHYNQCDVISLSEAIPFIIIVNDFFVSVLMLLADKNDFAEDQITV
ncbi:hypothetical protein ACHAXS_006288, partial [Conticribra weissflogii]